MLLPYAVSQNMKAPFENTQIMMFLRILKKLRYKQRTHSSNYVLKKIVLNSKLIKTQGPLANDAKELERYERDKRDKINKPK